MTFTGGLASINAALGDFTYTPDTGHTGSDTLIVLTSDLGHTGSGGVQTDTDTIDITVSTAAPTIPAAGVNTNPATPDEVLQEGEILDGLTQLLITFSEDMNNSISGDEVTNPANYLLLHSGSDHSFQTGDCAEVKSGAGVDPADVQIPITLITYKSSTYTASLNFGSVLGDGLHRLYACGTATLRDLAGTALAGDGTNTGTDFTRDFSIDAPAGSAESLPSTGFAPGWNIQLPAQPDKKAYAETGLQLVIPGLDVSVDIVGVPRSGSGWDVSWLGAGAGWLSGSAYPTWSGNMVLTGHVWDAGNQPGLFRNLKALQYGDRIEILAFGRRFIYGVRENSLLLPRQMGSVFQHEE